MGMAGKSHATYVNLFVFGVTGALLTSFSVAIMAGLRKHVGGGCFAAGGICFSLAGAYPFPSPYHFIAVGSAAAFLGVAIALLGRLRPLSLAVAAGVLANLVLIAFDLPMPGYISKISFAGVLVWISVTSFELLKTSWPSRSWPAASRSAAKALRLRRAPRRPSRAVAPPSDSEQADRTPRLHR